MMLQTLNRTLITNREYIPHLPTDPQMFFLALPIYEAFYGGAAGGGKSDALLMGALQYVHVPGYTALILRRTYADLALPEAIMDRARVWMHGTRAKWVNGLKTFVFPSGARLVFGYLQSENDKYRYQGAAFQYVAFDELTQFTLSMYQYMFSRTRRHPRLPIPLRIRGAGNPGGVGHEWVRRRFMIEGIKRRRVFIPARLDDNPFVDKESYVRGLGELDPVTQAQLLGGDWNARPGGLLFNRANFLVVPSAPAGIQWVLWCDLAATAVSEEAIEQGLPLDGIKSTVGGDPDYTCVVKIGIHRATGRIFIGTVWRFRKGPGDVEEELKAIVQANPGIPFFFEMEGGASGKLYARTLVTRVLAGHDVRAMRSTKDKLQYAKPFAAQVKVRNVFLVDGDYVEDFAAEAHAFPGPFHDDQVDAASKGYGVLAGAGEVEVL